MEYDRSDAYAVCTRRARPSARADCCEADCCDLVSTPIPLAADARHKRPPWHRHVAASEDCWRALSLARARLKGRAQGTET